jgi:hypothetical protein
MNSRSLSLKVSAGDAGDCGDGLGVGEVVWVEGEAAAGANAGRGRISARRGSGPVLMGEPDTL